MKPHSRHRHPGAFSQSETLFDYDTLQGLPERVKIAANRAALPPEQIIAYRQQSNGTVVLIGTKCRKFSIFVEPVEECPWLI